MLLFVKCNTNRVNNRMRTAYLSISFWFFVVLYHIGTFCLWLYFHWCIYFSHVSLFDTSYKTVGIGKPLTFETAQFSIGVVPVAYLLVIAMYCVDMKILHFVVLFLCYHTAVCFSCFLIATCYRMQILVKWI